MRIMTEKPMEQYRKHLIEEEKASATVDKYLRDVYGFFQWSNGAELDKSRVLEYKALLTERYAVASVNSILSSLNSFFSYQGWYELRVRTIKVQKQIFASTEKELTKAEYDRLLVAAKSRHNERLYLLMQTICSSGIRVSELKYITVESLQKECAEVNNKGKRRIVYLPRELCKILKAYCKEQNRKSGAVFVTKTGKPLDRSNIWSDMKKLCKTANVSEKKVFPHNLRHLFARTYYSLQKDVVRLADILGHGSVDTTRIYTKESGEVHRRQIQRLGLLRC